MPPMVRTVAVVLVGAPADHRLRRSDNLGRVESPATVVDRAISAAVRAVAAGRGITNAHVAQGVELANASFNRRLTYGGWTAAELVRLSAYFGARVDSLLTGLDGRVARPDA